MLSRQDYEGYLREMEEIEDKMAEVYQKCGRVVDDAHLKEIFVNLSTDEMAHGGMVARLRREINKKYAV